MKALLFLLILAAGGAAGYEIYLQRQNTADFLTKRAAFQAQANKLTAEHQKLAAEKDQDIQELAAIHGQAADLQAQIHGVVQAAGIPPTAATNAAPVAAH
jgi:hypothetical protein